LSRDPSTRISVASFSLVHFEINNKYHNLNKINKYVIENGSIFSKIIVNVSKWIK
jgi:hypothetical protein